MSSNLNIPDEKLNALLKTVSARMGVSPDVLKQKLESGAFDKLTQSLSPKDSQTLNSALNNPMLAGMILQNPKVKEALGEIVNKK